METDIQNFITACKGHTGSFIINDVEANPLDSVQLNSMPFKKVETYGDYLIFSNSDRVGTLGIAISDIIKVETKEDNYSITINDPNETEVFIKLLENN